MPLGARRDPARGPARLTARRIATIRLRTFLLAALPLALAACGADVEQAARCRDVLAVLEPRAEPGEAAALPAPETGVALAYRRPGAAAERHLDCRFAGGRLRPGRLDLVGVAADGQALDPMSLYWLERVLAMPRGPARFAGGGAEAPASPLRPWLYLLQQALNAAPVAGVYGLLAIGYTLVYGLIGRINLAFGEMTMIGAVVTVMATQALTALGAGGLAMGLLAVLVLAAATAALHGWTTERLVVRPLAGATAQAPLVATLGLALLLQEWVRLLHGAGNYWLRPPYRGRWVVAEAGGFAVTMTTAQILERIAVAWNRDW